MTDTTTSQPAPNPPLKPGDTITPDSKARRGTIARDREGDLWRFGRSRWWCLAPTDGVRVTRVARLGTADLVSEYGPVVVERTDRG